MNAQRHGEVAAVPPNLALWIEALPIPLMLLDDKGRTLSLNAAWQDAAIVGGLMSPSDHRGAEYVQELVSSKGFALQSGQDLAAGIRSILEGKQTKCTVLYELEEPGTSYEAVVQAFSQDPVAAVLFHVDRTDELLVDELTSQIEQMALDLEGHKAWRADQMRIIEKAMQETHGPLTPIRLRLHQLSSGMIGDLDEAQQAVVAQIARNVEHWWQVQEDMLRDLQGTHKRMPQKLQGLVELTLPEAKQHAIKAGVRLHVDLHDDGVIYMDGDVVRQTIGLLLEHAISQTPAGGSVNVSLVTAERACLTIQDGDGDEGGASWAGLRLAAQVLSAEGGELVHEADVHGRSITLCLPLYQGELHEK